MKNSFKFIWSLLFLFFCISGCEKKNDIQVQQSLPDMNSSNFEQAKESNFREILATPEDYDAFAKYLAKALENEELRNLLKKECLKKFDGDYDVLWTQLKSSKLSLGKQVIEIVKEKNGISLTSTTIENLVEKIPNLNICIPVMAENWNTKETTPMVAIDPLNEDVERIKAYDKDGNIIMLDAKKEPNVPVVVVGPSERVKVSRSGGLVNLFEKNRAIPIPNNQFGLKQSGASNLMAICSGSPYRQNGNYEYFKELKIDNVNSIESWYHSDIELRWRAYGFIGNSFQEIKDSGVITDISKNSVSNTWRTMDSWLFFWNNSVRSQVYSFFLIEVDDYGQTTTLSFPATYKLGTDFGEISVGQTVTFTHKAQDDILAKFTVDQDPCPPNINDNKSCYNGDLAGTHIVLGQ